MKDKDIDDVRGLLLHTNPSILYAVSAIALFHLLFDFLAFKSDVSFWRSTHHLSHISMTSTLLSAASSTVVLLYLIDQAASILVLGTPPICL
jgi:hypothetical protein